MSRNTLLAVLLASTASVGATWAQPAPLADACANYARAMQAVRAPNVPFPVTAGAVARTKQQAAICTMAASPGAVTSSDAAAQAGDAAAIQDAANTVAVAAAPYAQQGGARP